MSKMQVVYQGDLRNNAIHQKSGNKITTDAPLDNQGKGEAFSPTDLLCTSLASCILTIIGISANKHNFNIKNTTVDIEKIMNSSPRRVKEVIMTFNFPPNNYSEKEKKLIEAAVNTCPVALSLHPDVKQTKIYNY